MTKTHMGEQLPWLMASGPDPVLNDKLDIFGQFVGSWSIKAKYYQADGSQSDGQGELHIGWILDGRALQDVWISYQGSKVVPVGTTIRYFDTELDAIRCIWIAPRLSLTQSFAAQQVADEIVLEALNQTKPEKWIFSQITPTSFSWRAIELPRREEDWRLTEEMWMQRMGAEAHS